MKLITLYFSCLDEVFQIAATVESMHLYQKDLSHLHGKQVSVLQMTVLQPISSTRKMK